MFHLLSGSGSCLECGVPLRRSNFRVQLFEDPMVEKEVDIRKRVLRDFNKKEEDFNSLKEFNDYLEEVETIIFNLSNNIDVVETNKKIEQYKRENRDTIMKNKSKIGREELELEELLEEEKHQEELRKKEILKQEEEERKKKIREKEALIDELMFSSGNAKNIVDTFAQTIQNIKEEVKHAPVVRATQFSTGIKFGRQSQQGLMTVPKIEEGVPFIYSAPTFETYGPPAPTWDELQTWGCMKHIRHETEAERGGGYIAEIACMKALQEGFMCLFSP